MGQFKKLKNSLKYSSLLGLVKLILFIVQFIPWKWTSNLCAQLGKMAFYLVKKERIKTIENLTIAYGEEKNTAEIYEMAKEVFINLGRALAEASIKLNLTDKEKYFSNVEVVGIENARSAYQKGNGVINIIPHLGCWEAASKAYTLLGFSAGAVAKPLKNKKVNDWVIKKREFKGFKILERGSSYKTILRFLKQNNSLGMLIDQDTSVKGVFVDFYGKPAYTPIGAAMLALDSGASVFVASYVRTDGHNYRFIFDKPMELIRTGDRKEDLRINTERYQKAVEKQIKAYPTQWVWMHERWKTTPEMIEQKEREKQELRRKRREERMEEGAN
ncbi:MAG: lysophospholipid acyltransferase family protein [Cyclobacteriaceae bacterium]|nr:lysophospholipid acyltransferase family protein [Cyclobacteriaceae bacterium]